MQKNVIHHSYSDNYTTCGMLFAEGKVRMVRSSKNMELIYDGTNGESLFSGALQTARERSKDWGLPDFDYRPATKKLKDRGISFMVIVNVLGRKAFLPVRICFQKIFQYGHAEKPKPVSWKKMRIHEIWIDAFNSAEELIAEACVIIKKTAANFEHRLIRDARKQRTAVSPESKVRIPKQPYRRFESSRMCH